MTKNLAHEMPVLSTELLCLRGYQLQDVEGVVEASADSSITGITTLQKNSSRDEAAEFIERQISRFAQDVGYCLAVIEKGSEKFCGSVMIFPDSRNKRATLGYWIAASCRGKSFGSQALLLLSEWGFNVLELARETLYIGAWNIGSQKTAVAAGFEYETTLKKWELIENEPKDMMVYSKFGPVASLE